MKREDDQQLWDLLGKAAPTEISPFFARNVVRTIREQPSRVDWLRGWLRPRKLVPATVVTIAAAMAAVLATHQLAPRPQTESPPEVIVKIDPQDYDVVADLDELLATDESNLWDDDTQTL